MFNKDFYPTPNKLIDKMLSKIDLRDYNNILDPSVWKWNIIDRIKEKYWYWRVPNLYWIEIEYQLREISKNKCEIIWYDFLEFNNKFINFDLIIANFPFSNWVKHFLKAWEILWTGELVCLVSAETLKNPFSKERELMKHIIETNNWEVEYLEWEFTEAERKTNVEVALIKISKVSERTNIFEWFRWDFVKDFQNLDWDIKNNEIIVWNDKIDHIVKLNELLKIKALENHLSNEDCWYYYSVFNKCLSWESIDWIEIDDKYSASDFNEKIFKINQRCWYYFFQITPLKSKLTSKVFKDFIEEYQNLKIDFTYNNIEKVKDIIIWLSHKIQETNYIEIFDYLTKHRKDNREHIEGWKTNNWYQLKKRWIIPYGVDNKWNNWFAFTYTFRDKLNDIDKVFCNLTWKDFNKILQTYDFFDNNWTCEFFELKCYKKGTVHFLIKPEYMDALKQFNLIVCKSKKWIWF